MTHLETSRSVDILGLFHTQNETLDCVIIAHIGVAYKREVYMSILERTIQSVIFELGAILIGMLVIEFVPHEGHRCC